MGHILTVLELSIFQEKLIEKKKKKRKENYYNRYLNNASVEFDNILILLYWIYWFYVKGMLDYTIIFSPN